MAIYPSAIYRSGLPMGEEISACLPGTTLTLNEANVVGQSDPVEAGEPCVCGAICGVCVTPPSAANENLVVATNGIFSVPVKAHDGSTTSAVSIGEKVYINATTAIVSVDTDDIFFGYALAPLSGSSTPANIPVQLKSA